MYVYDDGDVYSCPHDIVLASKEEQFVLDIEYENYAEEEDLTRLDSFKKDGIF